MCFLLFFKKMGGHHNTCMARLLAENLLDFQWPFIFLDLDR